MIRFYCFYAINTILISNQSIDRIKKRYPYSFEVLTSIKDVTNKDVVKIKLTKTYRDFKWDEWLYVKRVWSLDVREKISRTLTGRAKPDHVRKKISSTMKGRMNNFAGHRHSRETKLLMGEKKLGNQLVKGRIWVNDGKGNEKRVYPDAIPFGWRVGRDYEIRELISYNLKGVTKF